MTQLRIVLVAFLSLCALALTAQAQDGTDDSSMGKKASKEPKKAKKAAEPAAEPLPWDISGRVFVRSESDSFDGGPWNHELKLDSARVGVSYRWKNKLRVKVTAELAGTPEVKDAYVDVDGPNGLDARAGFFKVPISVIENASAWDLPTVDRGQVAEIIEDGLGLSGRRDGVMVDWENDASTVRLAVMLSQSVAVTGQDGARPLADGGGLMATVRAEAQLCPCLRIGVHASNRETNLALTGVEVRRYWAGGADLELDLDPIGKGLRVWADVIGGQDHFYTQSHGEPHVTFTSAQGIAGWRLGGAKKGAAYIEPFVGGGYFNPNIELKRDEILDLMFGMNAGLWKRWRVQGQLEVVTAKGFRPTGLRGAGENVDDEMRVVLQLASAF
jgi:hypothetical protein